MIILLATAAMTFAAFTAIWAVSIVKRDAGIVDFYWGPGFAVISWLGWWLSGNPPLADLAFLLAVTLWGLRLGWYMTVRHSGAEDARYADMRRRHGENFGQKSLWMVFWLQAAIQWIAASPSLALMTAAPAVKAAAPFVPLQAVITGTGALLFIVGFGLEVAADRAVARFRADPANRGKLLTIGLHSRIRHPNYLGEIILQWGLGLFALGLTLQPLALVGPALMTGLIIRLSGVPLLEALLESRPGFAEWKARTGALWPRLFT